MNESNKDLRPSEKERPLISNKEAEQINERGEQKHQ
jgi:hypothetical protein